MMASMVEAQPGLVGTTHGGMTIEKADMFEYNDPIDKSVSKNQGTYPSERVHLQHACSRVRR
eukprot:1673987-Pleurochrysis_carterae.AAC.1